MAEQKKPNFPSKTCPRCGKYIHSRSKSHEECGWVEASSPASPATAKKSENGSGKPKNKMDAVRMLLSETGNADAKPLDLQDQLKKRFNIKMDPSVISNYKGTILRQGLRKKVGRPKGTTTSASVGRASGALIISLEDLRTVKDLAERLGAEQLRQLALVLAK